LSPSGKEERKLLHVLHTFTEQVITERREQILRHKRIKSDTKPLASEDEVFMTAKRRIAFLDMLITAQIEQTEADPGNALTDLDIREETDTFMFEGHDTTAANANWTTFLLGSYPEYQVKVYEELQEIFGDDMDRPMTSEDLTKMKYLECCIKESLRLYPSVPFVARAINSDLDLENGTVIPGGTTAFILPYMIHRDATVFPEPEVFLPDRFFPENSVGRNPFSYVPFSAGPRNCIGQKFAMMEEKVLLANLLRNFKVEAAERREDIILLAQLIMRPKNGLRVKLVPRR
jgi:cytochrome P450